MKIAYLFNQKLVIKDISEEQERYSEWDSKETITCITKALEKKERLFPLTVIQIAQVKL